MSTSLKKVWNDYGIGALVILLIVAYAVSLFANYLTGKGRKGGYESMTQNNNPAYNNGNKNGNTNKAPPSNNTGVRPANPLGQIEVFSAVNGAPNAGQVPTTSNQNAKNSISNPNELLPKDSNSQWAQLNPQGKGDLANINLLKAGYHIGIDTIGQTLRNANLQIRSEPACPQVYVGPWQQSTILPDIMRVPFEIGSTSYTQ